MSKVGLNRLVDWFIAGGWLQLGSVTSIVACQLCGYPTAVASHIPSHTRGTTAVASHIPEHTRGTTAVASHIPSHMSYDNQATTISHTY